METKTKLTISLKVTQGIWFAMFSDHKAAGWIPTPFMAAMSFDEVCDQLETVQANAGAYFEEVEA